MTTPNPSLVIEFERSQIFRTAARAVLAAGGLVAVYYLAPLPKRSHAMAAPHVAAALVLFAVVLGLEVRQILRSEQPMLRATVAVATVIPLFIVMFAWIYLVMSHS